MPPQNLRAVRDLNDLQATTGVSGELDVSVEAPDGERVFSELVACPHCELSFPELTPQSFSFNSPLGFCTDCNGLGSSLEIDVTPVASTRRLTTMRLRFWRDSASAQLS